MMQMWHTLRHPDHRWVFLRMLRGVSSLAGQRVSAVDRLHMLEPPVLLIWGERDRTLPVSHARRAVALLPRCQLEILPNCGHYPAIEQPLVVAPLLEQFLLALDALAPGRLERADHREMLMDEGGEASARLA